MPSVDDLYPEVWIKHDAVAEGDWTLTIKSDDITKFTNSKTGKDEQQIVLYFEETDLKLGVGKGNALALKKVFNSPNSEDWIGRKIVIGWAKTSAGIEYVQVREKPTEAANRKPRGPAAPTRDGTRSTARQPQPMTQAEVDGDDEGSDIPF